LNFKAHSEKQSTVLFSKKRITIAGTGIQWGKTIVGVVRLKLNMHKYRSPDDNFLVCSPSYKILAQSTLPPFMQLNGDVGRLDKQNYCFHIHGGGKVWFRTGQNPDSVVGITNVRHVLCDEAGLYSRYFWDNIQARASIKEAPITIVTSPYSLNWLYTDFIRKYQKKDPYIRELCQLIQATSNENPYFPANEYEARRRTMDPRRFNMIYGGSFEKADGLVYDCFKQDVHECEPFKLPDGTRYFGGIDWGYTDPFVISVRAITPRGMHYKVGEFYRTQCSLKDMLDAGRRFKSLWPIEVFECDPSRPDYISEFCAAGMPAVAAQNDINMGIDRHYELIKSDNYRIFKNTSPHTLDEYEQYHYPEPKDLKPDQDNKDRLPVDQNNHCIAEGTSIRTLSGIKKIEDVTLADKVLTREGFKKVLFSGLTAENKDTLVFHANDKNSLECTKDHLVFCNNSFMRADGVRYGDVLYVIEESSCTLIQLFGMARLLDVIHKAKIKMIEIILNVETNTCIGRFGNFIKEIFQKVFTFIISTVIFLIIELKICSFYRQKNIQLFTKRKKQKHKEELEKIIWTKLEILRRFGINQKKEENGTVSMLSKLTKIGFLRKKNANTVKKNSLHRILRTLINFVPTNVNLHGEGLLVLMTRAGNVAYVLNILKPTSILKLEPVLMAVENISLKKARRVYDLKIDEKPEFYANNILVHNCMDTERYISIRHFNVGKEIKRAIINNNQIQANTAYEPIDRDTKKLLKKKPSWLEEYE